MRLSFGGPGASRPPEEPAGQPGSQPGGSDSDCNGAEHATADGGSGNLEAGQRPLVIVVDNTEAADLLTLQDLILVLSEVRSLADPFLV